MASWNPWLRVVYHRMLGQYEQMITDLHAGKLEFDCECIEITQRLAENPKVFRGPGCIKQDSAGVLMFKIYTDTIATNLMTMIAPFHRGLSAAETVVSSLAGTLVPGDAYYDLRAVDQGGKEWTSARFLPDARSRMKGRLIITGSFSSLQRKKERAYEVAEGEAKIIFYEDVEFPPNASTSLVKTIAGEIAEESGSWDTACFSSAGFHFRLTKHNGMVYCRVRSESPELPPCIDIRTLEALQFIFARPLTCAIIETEEKNVFSISLHSRQPSIGKPLFFPPIKNPDNEIYSLFDSYFRYILPTEGQNSHHLSMILWAVLEGSAASLNAKALSLSVAVEGILKEELSAIAMDRNLDKTSYEKLKQMISDGDFPEIFKKRTLNHLEGMMGVRSVDILQSLLKEGIVEEHLVKAWKKVRNSYAHWKRPGSSPLDDLVSQIDDVTALFYKLMFHVIGYRGSFTDYSAKGWPRRKFRPPICTSTQPITPETPERSEECDKKT